MKLGKNIVAMCVGIAEELLKVMRAKVKVTDTFTGILINDSLSRIIVFIKGSVIATPITEWF